MANKQVPRPRRCVCVCVCVCVCAEVGCSRTSPSSCTCRKAPVGVGHALFVLSDDQLTRIFTQPTTLCAVHRKLCVCVCVCVSLGIRLLVQGPAPVCHCFAIVFVVCCVCLGVCVLCVLCVCGRVSVLRAWTGATAPDRPSGCACHHTSVAVPRRKAPGRMALFSMA